MIFLDCEFNGHDGELISMAMVSTNGDEFYEVVGLPHNLPIVPWVQENVIPKLGKAPISYDLFRNKVQEFLILHSGEMVIADSPADLIHLLDNMHCMTDKGKYHYLNLEVKMQFTPSGSYTPEDPHNALSDAKGLMKWYLANAL